MHIKPMQNAWSREKLQNDRKALKRWWSVGMLVLFTQMLQSEFINTRCLAFAFFSDAVVRQPDYGSHGMPELADPSFRQCTGSSQMVRTIT
uniref:Uncharacterized protein n=1 Tax=Oryza punctata TaxID=4537 RepID=A0A0E0K616_ORYPU